MNKSLSPIFVVNEFIVFSDNYCGLEINSLLADIVEKFKIQSFSETACYCGRYEIKQQQMVHLLEAIYGCKLINIGFECLQLQQYSLGRISKINYISHVHHRDLWHIRISCTDGSFKLLTLTKI